MWPGGVRAARFSEIVKCTVPVLAPVPVHLPAPVPVLGFDLLIYTETRRAHSARPHLLYSSFVRQCFVELLVRWPVI